MIACIERPDDLSAARTLHAAHPSLALWAVYPKGRGVTFGENEIRASLRAKGFRDTKSCAVSERLTATRYNLNRSKRSQESRRDADLLKAA